MKGSRCTPKRKKPTLFQALGKVFLVLVNSVPLLKRQYKKGPRPIIALRESTSYLQDRINFY